MIFPDIEERLATTINKLKEVRTVKSEFLPVTYTQAIGDRQTIPTDFCGWKPFGAPYALFEEDQYYWFKANFTIQKTNQDQKAYFRLNTHIDGQKVASTIRPQGLIYINGELTQGIDINHGEVLLENGEYQIYLLFYTHTFGKYLPMDFSIDYVDERINSLYYDLLVPSSCLKLLHKTSNEYVFTSSVIEKTLNLLDLRSIYSKQFYCSLQSAKAYLNQNYYNGKIKSRSVVDLIGHTHIDVAWMWDLDQTKQKVERSFATVIKLMDEYPEYRFFMSQPQLFAFLKERNPVLYSKVKQKILDGRWEVDGGMWVEADCNLTSGESLVRQIVFGKRFFKDEFGVDCETIWLPDVFGYSAALPQIMQKSGLKNFITAKIGWNDTNRMPYDAFLWKGIDGSEVFAYFLSTCECDPRNGVFDNTYTTYTAPVNPMFVLGTWNRFQQKEYTDEVLMSYGWGDGGGGPTREDIETERRLQYGLAGIPKAQISPLKDSIRSIKRKFYKNAAELRRIPRWNGELYFEYHRGTLTSVPEVKRNNRKGEFAMLNAELFSVLADVLVGGKYDKKQIDDNWRTLLLNQFHDILPGSSIADVYKDSRAQFETLFASTDDIIANSISAIVEKINTDGGIAVFNPNGFTANGTIVAGGKTRIVRDIPAFGYRVIKHFDHKKSVKISELKIENDYYVVKFTKSGEIKSLFDKLANREVVKQGELLNEFIVYQDTPYQYDNWEMTPYHGQNSWSLKDVAEFARVDDGDRKGFSVIRRYNNSTITQKIFLYENGIDRIDFVTDVDWKEKNQLLKVKHSFDIMADKAAYDIQFGHVARSTHDNTSWDSARFESVAHKWVDVSENNYGVALLNDGKYGFGANGGEITMTVLKSGSFPFDGASEIIPQFTYSILPHLGSGVNGGIIEKSYILNRPLIAKAVEKNALGNLPEEFSLIGLLTKGVIYETVKLADDGDGIIVRCYEAYNERKTVKMAVNGVKEAYLCDLNEKAIKELDVEQGVTFDIKPFEIVTVKLKGLLYGDNKTNERN